VKGFRLENFGKGEQKVRNRTLLISLAVILALNLGLIGCGGDPVPQYNLTISSTERGLVTTPGEGTGSFSYDEGEVVQLVAEPNEGYRFAGWAGDVGTIADVSAATTTITMSGNCSIMASFELERTTGPFLDEVLITSEPDSAATIQNLSDGGLDIYAFGLADSALYAEVLADPDLAVAESRGIYYELTFNPVGPTFPETGKLNPFSVPEFREAMHWLVDRDYIAEEICGGLAVPRYTCLDDGFVDANQRYPDLMADVKAKYTHNPARAEVVIAEEMGKLGAVLESGKWTYNGEPVKLIGLIRTEDERKDIGDYFADLLEGLGFTVTGQYGTTDDLSPIWRYADPALGRWHFYTAGWVNNAIPRDDSSNFGAFYTNLWSYVGPLSEAYVNDSDFYEAAERLWNCDYTSMEERAELFKVCLAMSMEDNVRMFLITKKHFTPMQGDVRVATDLVGGVSGGFSLRGSGAPGASGVIDRDTYGSWTWALTAHFVDDNGEPIVGGALRAAMPDVLTDPWNPVAGSAWVYDTFAIRATSGRGLQPDPRDGLRWPGCIERAEVYVQEGVPVEVTHDWVTLQPIPEIVVPPDAWVDWDATQQRFITVAERFPEGTTALVKSVVYYPKDIFAVPLHDGSMLSMGDFILHAVLRFDRAKEASPIYDESTVADFSTFIERFKGVKFIIDDPDYGLIIETYSDPWQIDAELCVPTWFPGYDQNPADPYEYSSGGWHTTALGIMAEEDGVLAFSQDKANALSVEWMSFIDGPSLPILKSYLDEAKATDYIPYGPTMGQYVTPAEAAERWSNLERWYSDKGHFWVGSGPFYLESANTAEKVIHLKRFEKYPDPMDKWLFLLEPLPWQM